MKEQATEQNAQIGQQNQRSDSSVREAINRAIERKQITPEQGEEIFWLHGYGMKHGLTNAELADKLQTHSKTVISLVFSGKYDAQDWTPFVRSIERFHRTDTNEVRRIDVGFIETDTAKTIWKACDNAWRDHLPLFMAGASQIGKTTALEEYVRRMNTHAIKYLYCPPAMTAHSFARHLAETCNLRNKKSKTAEELVSEIGRSLNPNSLLILDEFAHLTETVSEKTSRTLVDFVRMIYDMSHCGLVVSYTPSGREDLETGANNVFFRQFLRRGILDVGLPEVPSIRDINLFSKAFGLEAPHGEVLAYIKDLNRLRGLGVFLGYLNKAASLVETKNRKALNAHQNLPVEEQRKMSDFKPDPLTWDFFMQTARGFQALRQMKSDY